MIKGNAFYFRVKLSSSAMGELVGSYQSKKGKSQQSRGRKKVNWGWVFHRNKEGIIGKKGIGVILIKKSKQ